MNSLTQYNAAKGALRPGDVIAFSGTQPISWIIRLWQGSPISHTAVVRQGAHEGHDVTVCESTLDSAGSGARTSILGDLLATYGSGTRASALILREDFRKTIDWQKFYAFIGAAETYLRYDLSGLFGFALRELPLMGPYLMQSENPRQMFCDAYVIAIFEACGALRGINWRKMEPQDLAEMAIYDRAVPLLGSMKIRNFNTV